MPEIYIHRDMLLDAAKKMDEQQAALIEFVQGIDYVMNDILGNWEGNAQEAFARAWNEKYDMYKELIVDIGNFSKFIRHYVNSFFDIDGPGGVPTRF